MLVCFRWFNYCVYANNVRIMNHIDKDGIQQAAHPKSQNTAFNKRSVQNIRSF